MHFPGQPPIGGPELGLSVTSHRQIVGIVGGRKRESFSQAQGMFMEIGVAFQDDTQVKGSIECLNGFAGQQDAMSDISTEGVVDLIVP